MIAILFAALIGVYEGRTPCSAIANDFTKFPSQGCEKIKWRLTLRDDKTYLYEGTRTKHEGTWTISRGIYRLRYDDGRTLAIQKVDDNILLLLDANLKPLVGDASWNYTLCRTRPGTAPPAR